MTGNPISGAEFHIAYANGTPVDANNGRISSAGRYVTDSRGEITLTDVTGTIVVTDVIWYERCLSRQNTHITIAAGHLWRMIALCMRKAAIPA